MNITDIPEHVFTHILKFCEPKEIISNIYCISKSFQNFIVYYSKYKIKNIINNDKNNIFIRYILLNCMDVHNIDRCQLCTHPYIEACTKCRKKYCKIHCKSRKNLKIRIKLSHNDKSCKYKHTYNNLQYRGIAYNICDICYNKMQNKHKKLHPSNDWYCTSDFKTIIKYKKCKCIYKKMYKFNDDWC